MKRSDLKAGTDYLLNNSNDWRGSARWGSKRVTVVTLAGVGINHGFRARRESFELWDGTRADGVNALPSGTAVLVRDEKGRVFPTRTSFLRGEWDEAKAEVAAAAAAAQRVRTAEESAREQARTRLAAAKDKLRGMGMDSLGVQGFTTGGAVTIRLSTLEALIELAGEAADRRDADFVARSDEHARRMDTDPEYRARHSK